MHGKLERLQFCLYRQRPRKKKERVGCGMRDFDPSLGSMWTIISAREITPLHCPDLQCEGEAMQNSTRKAWLNFSLTPE